MTLHEWLDLCPDKEACVMVFHENGTELLIPQPGIDDLPMPGHAMKMMACVILVSDGNGDLVEQVLERSGVH